MSRGINVVHVMVAWEKRHTSTIGRTILVLEESQVERE